MRLDTCGYRGAGDCSTEQLPGAHYCTAHSHPIEMTFGLREVTPAESDGTDPVADGPSRVVRGLLIIGSTVTICVTAVLLLIWLG